MTAADLLSFFGRLHPMVLHLPIGLLIGLAVLEVVAAARPSVIARGATSVLAWLTAGASAVAVLTGLTLSRESSYGGETLQLHQWLGIGLGASCMLVALLHAASRAGARAGLLRAYRVALVVTLLVMVPAGHLGATMTHGEGFLTEPLRASRTPEQTLANGLAPGVFLTSVKPILDARCVACHGARRSKGGLRLDSPDSIQAGSEFGPVVVAGDPSGSEITRRLRLPIDDEDHMPPDGRAQPTDAEIKTVEDWIAAGAPFEGGSVVAAGVGGAAPETARRAPSVAAPDPGALAALREALVHVQEVEAGSNLLWIDFAATAPTVDDAAATRLLAPLVEQIADLSLARTRVGDSVLDLVARMPRLRRLDLRGTAFGDAGAARLAGHATLEELNVVGTKVSDAAVESLAGVPKLSRVHAWGSGIGAEGAARLRALRPELTLSIGDPGESKPLETEGALALSSDAPLPGQAPVSGSLTPINTACPVSGTPVNPKYSVVHEGRVIGFCCPNCPKEFWADPAKFADKLPAP